MHIAVLGATGPTGQEVVKEALERGYEVTAIVRNPQKITQTHDRLRVVKANIFDADSLVPHFEAQDAVVSCLGVTPSVFSIWSITFYGDSAKHIVEAMRKAGVSRFLFMSSWHTKSNPAEPFWLSWIIKPLFLGQSAKSMAEMEDYMDAECKDIDYTSVRAPQLTNSETTGKTVQSAEGLFVPNASWLICRRDVARFMLDTTAKGDFKKTFVAIATGS